MDNTNLVTVLGELRDESTKKGKQEILKENSNEYGFIKVMDYLLNPYKMVGISTKKLQKELDPNVQINDIVELIDYLYDHPTGDNETIAIVKGYLSTQPEEIQSDLSDIIAKTYTTGVSAKSVNKAYGKSIIPTFDVQLAHPYEKQIHRYTDEELFYVTQKLDGHRALTTVDVSNGKIAIETFTRRGQLYEGLNELHQNIIEFIRVNPMVMQDFKGGFALDGELLLETDEDYTTSELYRATSKVLRKNGEKKNIKYNVFDMLSLEDFTTKDESEHDYAYRRTNWLDELHDTEHIHVLPVLAVITKEDIPEWSEYATDHEWEGVMLNSSSGHYKKSRSAHLLKVKKMHTADLEIVGYNEAISGKNKGGLQSINVRLDDDNIVQVGSGLSDEIKEEIWNNKEKYMGVMVEIQYFEETENEKGGKSLRYPVFKDFRFDKTPEDANID